MGFAGAAGGYTNYLKYDSSAGGSEHGDRKWRAEALDSPATILHQQRAHVALRNVAELLGAAVRWEPINNVAHVTRP